MSKNIFKAFAPIAALCFGLVLVSAIYTGLRKLFASQFLFDWVSSTVIDSLMLVLGIALIVILAKGQYAEWGFQKCKRNICVQAFGWALALALVECVLVFALYFTSYNINSLATFYKYTPEDYPFFAYFLFLYLVISPISEEVLFRGYLQTSLRNLNFFSIKIFRITLSFPVIFTALFVTLIHILVLLHADFLVFAYFSIRTLINSLFLSYYREKSGSLLPSLIMTSTFNLFLSYLLYKMLFAFEHIYHG